MDFLEFKGAMSDLAYFNLGDACRQLRRHSQQELADWLKMWVKEERLIKIRDYYVFPEYRGRREYALALACRLYTPSYISLYTALSYYEMIPKTTCLITCITSARTNAARSISFTNVFGDYSYKTMANKKLFGFSQKLTTSNHVLCLADPEKALLDQLYFYPDHELQWNGDYLRNKLNREQLADYISRMKCVGLEMRVKLLLWEHNIK